MKSMSIKKQELTPLTKKRVSAVNQVGRVMACLLIVLALHSVGWADGTFDANKPNINDPTDNSCWMASGSNMMAADGWGDSQAIYNYLRTKLDWHQGGFQAQAINYLNSDPNSTFFNDPDEIIKEYGLGVAGAVPNARSIIDGLLATPTATETPGDIFPEGPDDPVGLGIYNDGTGLAHAITVWSDVGGVLTVTDSDDGVNGTVSLSWVTGSQTELDYHGTQAYVGYISFMSDVPEPSTLVLLSMGAISLAAYAWRKRRQAT